jgi:hypothetical protein
MQLFTGPSISTMMHGIVFGGGALLSLFAALCLLYASGLAHPTGTIRTGPSRVVALLTTAAAVALWMTVIGGTYVVFPPYRVPPPEGVTSLLAYPRAFVLSDPSTAWLHSFGMEIKEHVPWIAAMLTTAVAFVATRHREQLWKDALLNRTVMAVLALCLALVSFVSLLGVFVNKVAPVQ